MMAKLGSIIRPFNKSTCPCLLKVSLARFITFRSFAVACDLPVQSKHVCVVGSGPAGFYTAQQILKSCSSVQVDVYDKLPVPFGLARFGIAPDHPETKNCINQFTATALSERCSFIGNVHVGKDVKTRDLLEVYDAVVMCYGAESDRTFGIPGENLHGVYSARAFVEWYNGLPENVQLNPDLNSDTAVILGQGNVALDVARILLSPLQLLETTDICEHALDSLRKNRVRRVYIVGRRGPMQVAFTIKELREMVKLAGCRPVFAPEDFIQANAMLPDIPRPRKRLTELMCKTAQSEPDASQDITREWRLKFLRSPVEFLSANNKQKVSGVRLEINELNEGPDGSVHAQGTGVTEDLSCGLVFRSIGYKSVLVDDDVPFDRNKGVIPNINGRVIAHDPSNPNMKDSIIPGLYCSGWVRHGPVGVIATTMNDAFATGKLVIEDLKSGSVRANGSQKGFRKIREILQARGVRPVFFDQWQKIDNVEQERGSANGKPREKITNLQEMLDIAHRDR